MVDSEGNKIFIALGSNIGDKAQYLSQAMDCLKEVATSEIICSTIYETPPVGPGKQEIYLNMCLSFYTKHSPLKLLDFCKATENKLGRLPRERWGPREIDIDILLYGDRELKHPRLTLPHPQIFCRQFVLVPLHDIAPNLFITRWQKTVSQLLQELTDREGNAAIVPFIDNGVPG
ncbi:MAG: 2-amino-4-hydroxy-6-hydroxymethyldihydropteridine diphosphokinase [Fibrobacteria bacterium]|nr:2-amino-4-hydroxy-6-hydroxymethyldihydropteridine diphosphokinase [Fibrobacteria bacterium]